MMPAVHKVFAKIFSCLPVFLLTGMVLCAKQRKPMNLQELKDSIQSIVNTMHTPGLMLGIISKDSILFEGGFGYADVKEKRPVDKETLFRLGSITKMFVSLSVLELVKEGKLHLDDELKKIAPEIPFTNKWEDSHPLKIVHLLEHTAGFDDMKLNRMCSRDEREMTPIELVQFQQHSLISRWKPGERFSYSNPGYVILAYLIKKISGKSYDQYITENILRPLGMNHSNFNLRSKIPAAETKQYVVHAGRMIEVPVVNILMPPAGALWSCSGDMLKFIQLFLANGQPIFPDSLIHEMETCHSTLAVKAGLGSGYALANAGLFLYNSPGWRGHGGLMGTCFSTFAYNRSLRAGFVLSSNGNQQNNRVEKLVADFLEQDAPAGELKAIALDTKSMEPFLGQYQFENPRNEIAGFKDKLLNSPRLYLQNNTLMVQSWPAEAAKLIPVKPFVFAMEDARTATIVFTKNEAGKNVMIMNGAFFEQVSPFKTGLAFWTAAIAVLFALLSVVAGMVSVFRFIKYRPNAAMFIVRVLPAAAVLLLVWAVANLLQVQNESYLLSDLTGINTRTIIIFSGTLLFAVCALVHLATVLLVFKRFKSRLAAVYWLLTSLAITYITFILLQNGWIGLRTWAM